MYTPAHTADSDPLMLGTFTKNAFGLAYHGMRVIVPASGTLTADRVYFTPFYTSNGYSLARWWWQHGSTVGTNYIETGIYDENLNLFRASPRTLSAGTASQLQFVSPGIHGAAVTSGTDNTDATVYTTASVSLKAGVLYLMGVSNSKASAADAVSSIDSATGGYPTFTSRSSTTFDTSTAKRVSIWSAVPTADFTGTLRINFSATQTGACWGLSAYYHVDTATSNGIVQQNTATGNSATPSVTLSAFGSAQNAVLGVFGSATGTSATATANANLVLSAQVTTTPTNSCTAIWGTNDVTIDGTTSSGQWGACGVEIKSLGTGAVYVPPMRGWLAIHSSGSTVTFTRHPSTVRDQAQFFIQASSTGLPAVGIPVSSSGVGIVVNHGFTRSTSP